MGAMEAMVLVSTGIIDERGREEMVRSSRDYCLDIVIAVYVSLQKAAVQVSE
jgi:hypothetical protein